METQPPIAPPEDAPDMSNRPAVYRLAEAVVAVAKRPSRAAYATWMQVIEPGWIRALVVIAVCLSLLDSAISLGIRTAMPAPGSSSIRYLFGVPSPQDWVINALVINPMLGLLNLAVAVYVVAALIPAERGSLNQRAIQVARPYLLAQIVISAINIALGEPAFALGLSSVGQNPLVGFVITLINLAIGVYGLVAWLNALSAGSGRGRLLIFSVLVLVGAVSFLAVWIGLGALLSLVGIHLPVFVPW